MAVGRRILIPIVVADVVLYVTVNVTWPQNHEHAGTVHDVATVALPLGVLLLITFGIVTTVQSRRSRRAEPQQPCRTVDGRRGSWWKRAPARQRVMWATGGIVGWVSLLAWATVDLHAFLKSGPFAWLILFGWPFALPFLFAQLRRARRELRK